MRISLNTSEQPEGIRWYDNIWASLIFFTRLPWWRLHQPPQECYRTVVEHWPLAGWLTGGAMAAVIYFGNDIFSHSTTVILAIITRVLMTGALHEDGLADFFDGFGGGGNDRRRILAIMKDSHIGTYGVLALVGHSLLLYTALDYLPVAMAALSVFAADAYAKMLAAQAVMMLPYARTVEESKAHVIYRKMNVRAGIGLFIQGILPMGALLYFYQGVIDYKTIIFVPCLVMYALYLFLKRRLNGYTGDCCGALFLLIELSVYLTINSQYLLWKSF